MSTDDILQDVETKNVALLPKHSVKLMISENDRDQRSMGNGLIENAEHWSKSLPDLPKVSALGIQFVHNNLIRFVFRQIVGTIPKRKKRTGETPCNDTNAEFDRRYPSVNSALQKTGRQSRAYSGPVKYPVTPLRPIGNSKRSFLSVMVDSKDEDIAL